MKVERQITWWGVGTDTIVDEMTINHIPFEELKVIFHPSQEDPLMHNQYKISPFQAQGLNRWVTLSFDFDLYTYFVECWRLD